VGAGSAAEVLENACDEFGWTWYPHGKMIVILPKEKQIERQLEKTIVSFEYDQVSLRHALVDLTRRANLQLKMDPGVMTRLPPQASQRFSLTIQHLSVQTALQIIIGETGLDYLIEPDGIRVISNLSVRERAVVSLPTTSEAPVQGTVPSYQSNRIVGSVTVPNEDGTSSFSFFIREDDLPPEVKQMREWKIKKAVNQIRKLLHAEQPMD
jgi:hypothetical protein